MSDAHHDYRGSAGQVAGGVMKPGDAVTVLPSGLKTHITGIDTYDGPVQEAFTGMSVIIRLDDDIDISRGDMICRPANQPSTSQDIEALVCWMADQPLRQGGRYGIKQTHGPEPSSGTSATACTSTPSMRRDGDWPRPERERSGGCDFG